MGWERKRGKIEEFNRLLRGATDTSFSTQVGALAILPSVRYCITLDTDTRLPRDAAKALIGIIAHPLNRPRFDPRARPRHRGLRHPAAARQRDDGERGRLAVRAHLRRPHRRRPVHDRRLRRLSGSVRRRHLHRQGPLRRRRVHGRARRPRARERAAVARSVRGLYARTALVTDVEVVDDYPSSVLAHARRQHRWVRGDWQILWWLFPFVPSRTGLQRNRLPLISRWKILDNLRRSLMAPATVALLLAGWTVLPGRPLAWTAIGARRARAAGRSAAAATARRPGAGWNRRPAFLRTAVDDLSTDVGARRAAARRSSRTRRARCCTRSPSRSSASAITRHRLLEWETAAASAAPRRRAAARACS